MTDYEKTIIINELQENKNKFIKKKKIDNYKIYWYNDRIDIYLKGYNNIIENIDIDKIKIIKINNKKIENFNKIKKIDKNSEIFISLNADYMMWSHPKDDIWNPSK